MSKLSLAEKRALTEMAASLMRAITSILLFAALFIAAHRGEVVWVVAIGVVLIVHTLDDRRKR